MDQLRTGTIIDRYVIEGLIGQGGMATVYRVRHKDLDSVHALKVLTLHSDSIRERLRQEGKAQARLRHANIVSVTDLIDVEGAPGLIMECVDGPDLSQVMPLVQGDLALVDTLARGIISGVIEAHRLGMVHRDLKPANILIARQGERPVPKITDFGLVKVLLTDSERSHPTQSGSTMGTPAYMAPEQIRDPSLVDARADLFSLGVILYELVCGVKPFQGDMLEVFTAITAGDFLPPRQHVPDLPGRMERAILGALEVPREQRIPDCRVLFEIWEGRRVDWKAKALEQDEPRDPSWSSVLGSAWSQAAEQSTSQTAVPSSLDPGPSVAPAEPSETYYGVEPAETSPALDLAGQTYFAPQDAGDDELPSRGVVPRSAASAADDQAVAAPTQRGPLPWVLGAAALVAVVVGGWMLRPGHESIAHPEPEVAAPPPSTEPSLPAPQPALEVTGQPEVGVVPDPVTATVPPVVASEEPRPSPSSPEPSREAVVAAAPPAEPTLPPQVEEPAPVPAEAVPTLPAPTTATVTTDGDVRVWLVGSAGRFPPGELPPGSYTIMAFFDPLQPLEAGSFQAVAGDDLLVKCSTAMQRCTAASR